MSTKIQVINPFWQEVQANLAVAREYDYRWVISNSELRDKCCRMYAWAIPDPMSVIFVAQQLGPRAIEMGAGTGYWSWQISQLGVDILAYDKAPPDKIPNDFFAPYSEVPSKSLVKTWHPVQLGSIEVLAEHTDRTLLLCWPPYATDFAHQCLKAYQGNRLVFIGEGCGGCTGDDNFFALLDREWEEVAEHSIQQWRYIHDGITVYERGKEENE
ncbi:MAG TPA: hypothetical protein VHV10_05195 [Ktedonobacteraceae bacterium]|jgi:hypothetical protein|nr:hypothetical protein [Ktedonobacteraceae bacterium]